MGDQVRKIIHIDMDCFYASVEMRDNPALIGKPVAVGGKANQRGVLATCNYEARKFGLHSAMASAQAVKLCPDLVLLPVNMPLYKQVSAQIHHIFRRYTDLIEPLSLDEAYLDVTDCEQCAGSATWIAQAIRNAIWQELGLTASAGIAPLKFLAKIASEQHKPNGQFVITPEQVPAFIEALPLKKIPGVGKVTNEKLAQMGFYTCGDIRQSNPQFIYPHFGKLGQRLWDFCHGIDPRPVEANRLRKSVAVENTLLTDISAFEQAKIVVAAHFEQLVRRLQKNDPNRPLASYKKLGIKLKFDDFHQTTLERTMNGVALPAFFELLAHIWPRRQNRKIRLIGLSVQIPAENVIKQLNLWE